MASIPITSWQIEREIVEAVTDFIFLGFKITMDGDCSHEVKRCLLLGRKAMTNLNNILKSRDIVLLTKVYIAKVVIFPVVMYGCEGWTIKKARHQRIDGFELWCWRRFLRVPWTARRWNQSILRENQPWILFGRTDAKAEVPIHWPPDVKSCFIGKHPDVEFKQILGDSGRQKSLACCSPWGHKESKTT